MKVILLKDVAKIGRRLDIVEVPNGYARNQLIPKLMAEPASTANIKRIEKRQLEVVASNEAGEANFTSAIEVLRNAPVQIQTEVNEKGHTFKAVSADDIVVAAKTGGVHIESSMIDITEPIKSVGEHTVTLVSGGKKAEFTIEVVKK